MDFGNKLQNLRKSNGLSQEQLADKLNVSRQAVSKWESNSSYPEMDKIIAICKLFDCSIDELLNTKGKKSIENNKVIDTLNGVLNFISKSISMFLAMTFKQKIKCIFEMLLIVLILALVCAATEMFLYQIFSNISNILPREIYIGILSLGEFIYNIFAIIVSIIIFIHLFKTRYLDYYTIIDKEKNNEELVESHNNTIYDVQKDKKIIIRDPKDSSISIIRFIKKCFNIFLKGISIILIFFGSMSFAFLVAATTIIIWYIMEGPVFVGGLILALGFVLLNYIILHILYKFVTNKKQNIKTIFIICITSLILMGSGFGIAWYSFSRFETKEIQHNYITKDTIINFKNNIAIEREAEYKIDKTLKDKIKIKYKYIDKFNVEIGMEQRYIPNEGSEYFLYDFYFGYANDMSFIEEFNYFIDILKKKEIPNYQVDDARIYYITIYGSEKNIETIKENNIKIMQYDMIIE